MSSKAIIFDSEAVLQAALAVVRQRGWDALTARSVAGRLGASVAPVYSVFASMENLLRETLIKIRDLLQVYTAKSYTEYPFLNIGVGIVLFARDEPHFFQALFQKRHGFQEVVEDVNTANLAWMKSDAQLGLLSDEARERLYDSIGFFTMGFAAAVAAGRVMDVSNGNIIRLLKNMGNSLKFAEFSGVSAAESPESKREWSRLIKKKNASPPTSTKVKRSTKIQ